MRLAMRSRLEPFKKFVRILRGHLDGILGWTRHHVSNGAVEGMNNKIKSISHRSFDRYETSRRRFDTDDPSHDTHKVLQFNRIAREPEVGILPALLHIGRSFEWSS